MVPSHSLRACNFQFMKVKFCLIDFPILSVDCSHVCIKYVKIYENILSGGLEVSLSIFESRLP